MHEGHEEGDIIKAVLWDLDGTLINSDRWHADALEEALADFGYSAKVPSKFSTSKVFAGAGVDPALHEALIARRWDYTTKVARAMCRPSTDIRFALAGLRIDGYRNIIVSNSISEYVMAVMWRAKINKYIDGVLSGDMGKHKPDPDLYLKAWSSIRCKPEECLAVEDADSGVTAARAAGVHVWQVAGPQDITYENLLRKIREVECSTSSFQPQDVAAAS